MCICTPTSNSIYSPYGQHQGGQLQQAGQGSHSQGSRSRRARGGRAHQRWKEAGQRQGQKDKTAEENIQEGAEGGARKCLHLHLVLHLEGKRDVRPRTHLDILHLPLHIHRWFTIIWVSTLHLLNTEINPQNIVLFIFFIYTVYIVYLHAREKWVND